jgi:hypothetical protein
MVLVVMRALTLTTTPVRSLADVNSGVKRAFGASDSVDVFKYPGCNDATNECLEVHK